MNIKPCPFCGSEARFWQRVSNYPADTDQAWDIVCTNDVCYLAEGADYYLSKTAVSKLWNSRSGVNNERT